MSLEMDLIKRLPKAELHLHVDGSMRVDTVSELASLQGVKLTDLGVPGIEDDLEVWGEAADLGDYLRKFSLPLLVLQEEEALERAAYELVEDVRSEEVLYVEIRFAPLLHTSKGLTPQRVIEAVLAGMHRGAAEFGVRAGLIACCMRHHSPEDNLRMAQVAVRYRQEGLVALDLAGDEAKSDRDSLPWESFRLARDEGLGITIHAGEAAGAPSIRAALDLGAQRLGHGIRLEEDQALMDEVRERGIALEMCPTSNVQTDAVADLSHHPIDRYLRSHLLVTVSTDNRRVSDTTMTREYQLLAEQFGWGISQVQETTKNALQAAFLPPDERKQLISEYQERWLTIAP